MNNWFEEGYKNIWLPYTQMANSSVPLSVKSASGSRIILEDGRELVDGISSWWSVCHGYQHAYIIEKMQKQLDELSHVMFAGLAHEPAYTLAKRISNITPEGLERVFFADSGSNAVEVAMKMSVQYWSNKGNSRKNKFISFKSGYHGDTMGALSLGDPDGWIPKAFNHYMPKQYVLDIPTDEYSFAEFEAVIKDIKNSVAGLIIEPLVQGAGGMKFYGADILAEIRRICSENDIIFIADEIMTGFYRTGSPFACNEAGISPDIMCVGKALTGGMISLAATVATEEIFSAFLSDKLEKAFMHGPTFMANPLACSAANASLDLFEKDDFSYKIEKIERVLNEGLFELNNHRNVLDVRVKGAIGVVQLRKENFDDMWGYMFSLREKFVELEVWLRPFSDVIYIMPDYNISENDLGLIVSAINKIFEK